MFEWTDWLGTLVAVAIAVIAVALVAVVLWAVTASTAKRAPTLHDLILRLRPRTLVLALLIALWVAANLTAPAEFSWWPAASRTFFIAIILVGAWLVAGLASFGFGRVLGRETMATATLPEFRRMRTQLLVLRRLTTVLISIVAVGVVLFSFPEVRAVGTSVLASAGIVSIIAGLAAQSTLGNLIAGIQLVFSNAIRVDDVVVIEGNWGKIGEITLSYVVVNIWDERRLVLPCTYFTTQPFESWTRNSALIMGTVFFDVDWRFPIEDARTKFMEILQGSDSWDGRSASMVVVDAVGGHLSVRCTVSAEDSGALWNLRCLVREQLVTWLREEHPDALPVTRLLLPDAPVVGTAVGPSSG
ncbi:MAG TPA: mechanosensitive ion channel domain-containing protein [Lacisediminihabitans sp.]|jgi:small-conductance mechanosensitive channel|nr:mechanosensitive ion channel domain-containing protein [Lacisediminihabitans sp.]HXD61651.1 mechanosensitive ion channel domain-containing protein [Lacisediminihabitans sp.]